MFAPVVIVVIHIRYLGRVKPGKGLGRMRVVPGLERTID
jgi:hypothetical protein